MLTPSKLAIVATIILSFKESQPKFSCITIPYNIPPSVETFRINSVITNEDMVKYYLEDTLQKD